MNENTKKILMVLGGIVAVYLFITFVWPLIWNLLTFLVGLAFKLILAAAIIVGIFVIGSFVIKNLKK